MADKNEQKSAPEQAEKLRTPGKGSDRDIRQAESSLARAEALVGEALGIGLKPGSAELDGAELGGAELGGAELGDDELGSAARRLALAQWSLGRRDTLLRQWPRQATIVIATTATVVYLIYRLFWTMNLASPAAGVFSATLLMAEIYAALSLGLYFFQVWRLVEPPLCAPTAGRTVDVFVCTYNEDVTLLRGTLAACVEMDYPHNTYILDDGARDTVRTLAESLGVRYISRTDRTHAKAGNLNNALRQTDGEFVIILDADHVPYRHYITRLIGYFDDPRMGFVQAPHTTYNLDNFMGRWKAGAKGYWEDVRLFFEAVQLGKNNYGVACFCGSAAIFRRKALEDVGLIATETITEDMHTGMRINAAGWKSIAVSEEMVVGLAPDDVGTFASQRLRWGEGNLSVVAYDNPLTMKGLTLSGRINHFASIASWTLGPARLVMYLTPIVMLLTGLAPVADMSVTYFAIVGCYLVSVWTAVKVTANGCGQLLGIELAMMASFHLQIQALWRAIFRRRFQKFVVTTKRRVAQPSVLRRMWPQAALIAVSLVAVSWAASRIGFGISNDYLGLIIGGGLASYHAWIALTILSRALRKRDVGDEWRHPARLAVDYAIDDVTHGDVTHAAVSIEFNESECRLLTWKPLGRAQSLAITLHSPIGNAVCHGRVVESTPIGQREPFAYLSKLALSNIDAGRSEEESDSLRWVAMRYVVPVVTRVHRSARRQRWPSLETTGGEADLPIPLTIDARLPNIPIQKAVAVSFGARGFFATLRHACPIGHLVRVTLSTPLGPIDVKAEVYDVDTTRVGSDIVHQHEFRWRDKSLLGQVMSKRTRWASAIERATSHRLDRHPFVRLVALQLAACLLVALTVFAFGQVKHHDILLATAANRPLLAAEVAKVEYALERLAYSTKPSTQRLLRIYEAAVSLGKHSHAAEAARLLADRVEQRRCHWIWASARQLVRHGDHKAADATFDEILAENMDRELLPDERVELYVESARAAVEVGDLDKAVERFSKATDLRAADLQQVKEFLGVLIAAGRSDQALGLLRQMERSDAVLRRIIDVHELAKTPEQAVPELKELRRRHPDDPGVVRRLAELAVVRRDFDAGLNYYKSLRKMKPDDQAVKEKLAETMLLAAREHVAADRFDEAFALFDESFRLHPPDGKVKRAFAGVLAKAGRADEAIDMLDKLEDADSRILLASLLEMHGHHHRALRTLLELENVHTIGKEPERTLVRLLLANQMYGQALDRLIDLMEKEPEDETLRRTFIDAVAASDRESHAVRLATVDVFDKYRESGFQALDAEGFERLGDALRRLKLFAEADTELSTAVARFPEARRLRLRLAQVLGQLGRYDAAEVHYVILLDTRPSPRR